MSDAAPRRTRLLRGAGVALALFSGMAAQAEARGLVADQADPGPAFTPCDFVNNCSPISLGDSANTPIYVYADGVVSIGTPLNNPTLGDLSTFGDSYIAVGLFDYSGLGMSVKDGTFFSTLEFRWTFSSNQTFGLNLTPQGNGLIQAILMYADGMTLPDDALIGSSYTGCQTTVDMGNFCDLTSTPAILPVTVNSNFTYPNYVLTVPEPLTLPLFCTGLAGVVAMRRRKAKG